MARFKYLGEELGSVVTGVTWGPCTEIRMHCCDGHRESLFPVPPATEFVVGEDIGHDILDDRCVRHLRAWTLKFEEIV